MIIRPNERQQIADILREELEQANHRISERLAQFECGPATVKDDRFDSIRRFYDDLVNKPWTEADEECINSLADLSEEEIKQMMREGFRRSRVHPVPSFAALINVVKRGDVETAHEPMQDFRNPDAMSAAERERLANLLHKELTEAVDEIASRLHLGQSKIEIVREQLEIVEGSIISRFTPLV